MNRYTLMALFIATFSLPGRAEVLAVSQQQILDNSGDLVIIDVRSRVEYDSGHIANTIHIPFDTITSNPSVLREYREKLIVIYCKSGGRTRAALEALDNAGYDRLGHLEGDMDAWREAGLPEE